jgi:hypothetical protein
MRWNFKGRCDQCGFQKTFWFVGNQRMMNMAEAGAKALERYMPHLAAAGPIGGESSHPINDSSPIEAHLVGDSINCPCCGRRFKQSDRNRWDGERHLTCGQRIILKEEE